VCVSEKPRRTYLSRARHRRNGLVIDDPSLSAEPLTLHRLLDGRPADRRRRFRFSGNASARRVVALLVGFRRDTAPT
jgi:hypothetical protein